MSNLKIINKTNYRLEKHPLDAGYDLRNNGAFVQIGAGASADIPTGIFLDLSPALFGLVVHRSSLAFKGGSIASTGIIDSSYKGEIRVKVFNLGNSPLTISSEERFAQLILLPAFHVHMTEVEAFDSEGKDGFGSTGRY
jgi:dUTP pyrophosphatase